MEAWTTTDVEAVLSYLARVDVYLRCLMLLAWAWFGLGMWRLIYGRRWRWDERGRR